MYVYVSDPAHRPYFERATTLMRENPIHRHLGRFTAYWLVVKSTLKPGSHLP